MLYVGVFLIVFEICFNMVGAFLKCTYVLCIFFYFVVCVSNNGLNKCGWGSLNISVLIFFIIIVGFVAVNIVFIG